MRNGGNAWSWLRPWCLALCLVFGTAQAAVAAVAGGSEPAEIRALRGSQARSAAELRQQAIDLRDAATDRIYRAWATLAFAEFANDLEASDEALAALETVISEASALGLDDLKFQALDRQSTVLVNRGRTADTEIALAAAKQLADASGNPLWQAQWLLGRGVLERKLGRFDSALDNFQQALEILRQADDELGVANALNSIGMLHGRTGRFSDAMLVHKEALELARKSSNRAEIARSLRLLGVLHRSIDDEELGSRYLKEALEFVEQRNKREAITLHGELTRSLMLLGRLDEAETSAELAVAMAEESGSPPNRVSAYTRMAELRLQQGKLDDGMRWTTKAFESFDVVAIRDQILLRLTRAQVLAARGLTAEALAESKTVLEATRKVGDRILERAALDLLSQQQLLSGDAANAFVTLKAYQALDKELAIDLAARRIAMLEGSLANERTEGERALLERDNAIQSLTLNRQRLLGIGLIAGLAILLALAGLLYSRFRAAERSKRLITTSRDELARLHQALLDGSAELAAANARQREANDALSAANAALTVEVSERAAAESSLHQRNTELLALARVLEGAQSQLLQSERMASVGQLAAGVAHEINNPIGYVYSNMHTLSRYLDDILELIKDYEALDPVIARNDPAAAAALARSKTRMELEFVRKDVLGLLAESLQGIVRVEKIVKDLKEFSHVGESEWQCVDIHAGLESTLNVVAHDLKYKAELVRDYAPTPPIECLPFQLNQVFLNLLINAVQSIPKQGQITLTTRSDEHELTVSVSDTGKGIAPADLGRIFDPFFTTKPVGQGTGLGLSVSYGIVQRHGGRIEVASAPGVGTTFTVHLPLKRAVSESTVVGRVAGASGQHDALLRE